MLKALFKMSPFVMRCVYSLCFLLHQVSRLHKRIQLYSLNEFQNWAESRKFDHNC